MGSTSPAAPRPSQLSTCTIALLWVLLTASFTSGAFLWWGAEKIETWQAEQLAHPQTDDTSLVESRLANSVSSLRKWMFRARVLHGAINPVLAVFYGWMLSAHVAYGVRMRANLKSGLPLLFIFGALILTGAGIYYATDPMRSTFIWIHQIIGILWPVSIGIHWLSAKARQKKQ